MAAADVGGQRSSDKLNMTSFSPELLLEAAEPRVIQYRRVGALHVPILRIRLKEEVVEIGFPMIQDALRWLRTTAVIVAGGSLLGTAVSCAGLTFGR